jgi:hypothetical protein
MGKNMTELVDAAARKLRTLKMKIARN